jgi:tetratricopeptide (TPR) repeat protein
MLEKGETKEAAVIFQAIAERKEEDVKKAAAAYRHLGALSFLDDTQKALAAYRRATELEPDNAVGWEPAWALTASCWRAG